MTTIDEVRMSIEKMTGRKPDLTLDGIAALWPEGWWWRRYPLPCTNVVWEAGRHGDSVIKVKFLDTGNEHNDRLRLLLAVLEAEKGAAK